MASGRDCLSCGTPIRAVSRVVRVTTHVNSIVVEDHHCQSCDFRHRGDEEPAPESTVAIAKAHAQLS
jgi:C4-type Zn-finger protein